MPRHQLVFAAIAVVVVAALGMRYVRAPAAEPARPALKVEQSHAAGVAVVHVAGAVRRPGVYRLAAGSRVADAVRKAGGATRRAELAAVNLAAKVEDGRQVLVPARAAVVPGASTTAVVPGAPGAPLDLNTATEAQLDELDGVGPATARKILAYRDQNGGFSSVDELAQVPGIGEKRLAALRELVRV